MSSRPGALEAIDRFARAGAAPGAAAVTALRASGPLPLIGTLLAAYARGDTAAAGAAIDFSTPVQVVVNDFQFEAPHLGRPVLDVGIMLRYTSLPLPGDIVTHAQGIVATAPGTPAGASTAALQALVDGNNVAGDWTIQVLDLPPGMAAADIDDVLLMLRYTFDEAQPA